jgi:valyl-tRNA synthetase
MGLVIGNTPGSDLALREDKIKGYKHFANKVWNASRFVVEQTEGLNSDHAPLTENDKRTLSEFQNLLLDVTKDIDAYRYYMAGEKLYHYFWHTFADVIIEETKVRIKTGKEEERASAQKLLSTLLSLQLRALHPFMPFVTESLWDVLPSHIRSSQKPLALTPWPM